MNKRRIAYVAAATAIASLAAASGAAAATITARGKLPATNASQLTNWTRLSDSHGSEFATFLVNGRTCIAMFNYEDRFQTTSIATGLSCQ